jgi:hypothetical protein
MYQNSWEMEVHARDLRERRLRQAARARLLDAAAGDRQMAASRLTSHVASVIAMASAVVSRVVRGDAARQSTEPAQELSAAAKRTPAAARMDRQRRQMDPFADMVVIARGRQRRSSRRVQR